MKKNFELLIISDNNPRLISRIIIIFNRRNFFIKEINFKYFKSNNELNYKIEIECDNYKIINLIKQIKNLIGVIKVHCNQLDYIEVVT